MESETKQIKIGKGLEEMLFYLLKPILIYPEGKKPSSRSDYKELMKERWFDYYYNKVRDYRFPTDNEILIYLDSIPENIYFEKKTDIKYFIGFRKAKREYQEYKNEWAYGRLVHFVGSDGLRFGKETILNKGYTLVIGRPKGPMLTKKGRLKIIEWGSSYYPFARKYWKIQSEEYSKMVANNYLDTILNFPPPIIEVSLIKGKIVKK